MKQILASLVQIGQLLVAISLAIGAWKGFPVMVDAIRQWRKPAAEIGLLGAQESKTYAEASAIKTAAEISLVQVAIDMANNMRAENDALRRRVDQLDRENGECRKSLEKANDRIDDLVLNLERKT